MAGKDKLIGKSIAGYRLVKYLNGGGVGDVYLGVHNETGQKRVVKVLREEYNTGLALERFKRGCKINAKLSGNENIVEWIDSGYDSTLNRHYLVMECIDGKNLDDFIHQEKPTWQQCLKIIRGIANALRDAHYQGFVHRDIKPSNIIIEKKSERAVVIDFDIAAPLNSGLTGANPTPHTYEYAAPEQKPESQGQVQVDERSDIYSFGLLIYEMITGERLNDRKRKDYQVMLFQPKEQTGFISNQILEDKNAPSHVRNIIIKCIQKNKDNRFQYIGELENALLETVPVPPDEKTRIDRLHRSVRRRWQMVYYVGRRRRSLAKAILAAMLILMLLLASSIYFTVPSKDTKIKLYIKPQAFSVLDKLTALEFRADEKIFTSRIPRELSLQAGTHVFELLYANISIWKDTLHYAAGQTDTIFIPIQNGKLRLSSYPAECKVYLNSRLVAERTPVLLDSIDIGDQTLGLEAPGYFRTDTLVAVNPNEIKRMHIALKPMSGKLALFFTPTPIDCVVLRNLTRNSMTSYLDQNSPFINEMLPNCEYKLEVFNSGYTSENRTFSISPKESKKIKLSLKRLGVLEFQVIPYVKELEIDNRLVLEKAASPQYYSTAPDSHLIKLANPDGGYVQFLVHVMSGETTRVAKEFLDRNQLAVESLDFNGNEIRGAQIYINGETKKDWTTPQIIERFEGYYLVDVRYDGYDSVNGTQLVYLNLDKITPIKFTLRKR